jgi:hypothetical protein
VISVPTRYARTLRNEFNAVVVDHHLKWAPLCVSEPGALADGTPSGRLGRYDFHHADAVVDYANKHNMKVKGHVLVCHLPFWRTCPRRKSENNLHAKSSPLWVIFVAAFLFGMSSMKPWHQMGVWHTIYFIASWDRTTLKTNSVGPIRPIPMRFCYTTTTRAKE